MNRYLIVLSLSQSKREYAPLAEARRQLDGNMSLISLREDPPIMLATIEIDVSPEIAFRDLTDAVFSNDAVLFTAVGPGEAVRFQGLSSIGHVLARHQAQWQRIHRK